MQAEKKKLHNEGGFMSGDHPGPEVATVEEPTIVIGKAPRNGAHADLEEERGRLRIEAKDGVALCLSGGGIRSATFSLGVIQALAQQGWLQKFTYLSTVSGGGYIGSWLSSWIRRAGIEHVAAALPAATGLEPEEIRRLRASSNYLSPRGGISADLLTLVSTFLRNLFINWSILIPVLVVIAMLPMANVGIAFSMIAPPENGSGFLHWSCVGLAAALVIMALAYIASDIPDGNVHQTRSDHYREFVYFPVLAACYLLSLALMERISTADFSQVDWWADTNFRRFVEVGASVHAFAGLVGTYIIRSKREHYVPANLEPLPAQLGKALKPWIRLGIFLAMSGAFAGAVAYLGLRLGSQLHGWVTKQDEFGSSWSAVYATVAVPFLLLCFFLGSVLHVALIRRNTDEGAREWWGRSGGTWIQMTFVWLALHAVCIWLPVVLSRYGASATAVGGSGAVGGVLVAVIGYYSKHKPDLKQDKDLGMLEKLNIRVLDLVSLAFICAILAVITLFAVDVGANLAVPKKEIFWEFFFDLNYNMPWKFITLLGAGVMAISIAWTAGVNAFSMHAMYGNRLVRAYLGATRPLTPPTAARMPHAYTGFDPDDDLPMAEERKESGDRPTVPFHVINTALNIVRPSGEHLEWQERKAASFTITPLRTGSRVTGYCRTRQIGGRANVGQQSRRPWGVTIGRAMTVSGAAAAPSMGFHSSRLVAIVMTFFNVRLGWWMRNPAPLFCIPGDATESRPAAPILARMPGKLRTWLESWGHERKRKQRAEVIKELCHTEPASPLQALIAELTGDTREDSDYVYLSDGGHFENLGLYEMARRQCKEIVVVDAGCDPRYEYEDLERAIRIIRNDFNAEIDIPDLPTAESIKATRKHYALGTITYRNAEKQATGRILYIKPGLDGGEPLDVDRYANRSIAKGEPFPHQSTADQFFDEPQFESYRALGRYSVRELPELPSEEAFPIEVLLRHLAESAAAEARADTPAAPAEAPAAAADGKARSFADAISDLISWDKLPGLIATALGSTAVISAVTPDANSSTGSATNNTTMTQPANDGSKPEKGAPGPGDSTDQPMEKSARATGDPNGPGDPAEGKTETVSWIFPVRGFGEGKLCRKPGPVCDDGTRLSKTMVRKLRALNDELVKCGPSTETQLTFTVRGYASTSDYSVKRIDSSGSVSVVRHPDSERLNLALADSRARAAGKFLEGALSINVLKGKDPIQTWMAGVDAGDKAAVHARFVQLAEVLDIDHDEAEFDSAVAGDNRRVDVEVTSPGNCKQAQLQAAIRTAPAAPMRTASAQ